MSKEDSSASTLEESERRFNECRGSILGTFLESLEKPTSPSLIYHYTDDRGLYSILTGGRLWFSNLFDLNDTSELHYIVDVACNVAQRLTQRKGTTKTLQDFAKKLRSGLKDSVESTAHYFVCCFSEDGDDLGQWRAYATDGKGYALAFDRQELEDAFTARSHKETSEDILQPFCGNFCVNYDKDDAQKVHEELIECVIPILKTLDLNTYDSDFIRQLLIRLSVELSLDLLLTSMVFKHEAYKNEKEYRFLQVLQKSAETSGIKYRQRSHSLVKYREFDWRNSAPNVLKKIVIGPAADLKTSNNFVEDCLRASHYPLNHVVNVSPSEIPYRSFR